MMAAAADTRLLLLTDWVVKNKEFSLLRELLALGHECDTVGVNITRSYGSRLQRALLLWSGFFWIGLKGFLRRKSFDVVIAHQGVAGLFYSFFKMLSLQRRPRLFLMAFFFKKRKSRIYNGLRYAFTRAALGGVDRVLCYSSKESEFYNRLFNVRDQKFQFVPYGVNVARLQNLRQLEGDSGDYIFSAGSSNRDYATLFDAVDGLDIKVVVIAKRFNLTGLRIPDNVEVMYDVYGEDYYRKLLGARFVIIPLDDPELSSGQMVLLESMGLGKAVIVSEVWGVSDYVTDEENVLCVPVQDSRRLRERIESLLRQPQQVERLSRNGQRHIMQNFTVAQTARGVSRVACGDEE